MLLSRSSVKIRPLLAVLVRNHRCVSSSSDKANGALNNFAQEKSIEGSTNATDDAISVDGTVEGKSTIAAQCVQPRPIFPWRSSPEPLERLIRPIKLSASNSNDTEESERAALDQYYNPLGPGWPSPMEAWFRGALFANSMHLLGLSWPKVLFPFTRQQWVDELEWSFCHAFSRGVQGMIDNTYILPENETSKDEAAQKDENEGSRFDVNLDVTLDPLPKANEDEDDTSSSESNGGKKSDTSNEQEEEEYNMLQRNLRQLYQSARQHSHPSKVNIVLKTVPQSATIESMYPLFGLSRSLVEDHPNLRHTYRNLMQRLQKQHKEAMLAGKKRLNILEVGQFVIEGLQEIMENSAKLSRDGNGAITIISQVSIDCKEVFCVRDVESGEVIQGYDDCQPRDVTHLVRFEMLVRFDSMEEDWELEIGRWQITDWDDLLDGNVFFA